MPTTGVVLDAFKSTSSRPFLFLTLFTDVNRLRPLRVDILRHGKAHNDKSHHKGSDSSAARARTANDNTVNNATQQQQQQRIIAQNAPMPSPDYRREAELIVEKERLEQEEKSKMPIIKGLEKYKLIEKMGE